jgi:hypothetical protein
VCAREKFSDFDGGGVGTFICHCQNGYSRIHEERSSNLLVIRYFNRPLQYFNRGLKHNSQRGKQPIRVRGKYKISSTKSGEALWNKWLPVPHLPVFEAAHLSSI